MARFNADLLTAYLEFTKNHEATERVHKWAFLSVVAAALERKVWIPRGYYTLFPNLYVFIIGKSGLIKKSTSTGIAVNLFRDLAGPTIMSERLTATSLIQQMVRASKRFEWELSEIQHASVFAYASELSVFLTEVFGSIVELLTTFYDCVPNDSTKPWVYNTMGRGEMKIYGPCLNILGASTKTWLKQFIPASHMEGGFASRIIFVVEDRLPERLIAWPELPKDNLELRERLLSDLKDIYLMMGEFQITVDARKYFSTWYEYHMRTILPKNMDAKMVGYMSRKGDTALKLAMIRAATLGDERRIDAYHIEWAINELNDLEGDWRSAFELRESNPDDVVFEVRKYIKDRLKIERKKLYERLSHYPGAQVDAALQKLVDMGDILSTVESGKKFVAFIGGDLSLG